MKKLLFCLSALLIISSALHAETWDGTVASSYAGGDGTKDNPYLISNGQELAKLASDVETTANFSRGKYFKLTADIVLADDVLSVSSSTLQGGTAFTQSPMIGLYTSETEYTPFQGVFDGDGHSISGVYLVGYVGYIALFRVIEGATIKNLTIKDSYQYNNTYSAGVVSLMIDSKLINCCATGSKIIGYGSYEGGLVGQMKGTSTVQNCYSAVSIQGKNNVGGICGRIGSGEENSCVIENSYSASTITISKSNKAGITAENAAGSVVRNCYWLSTSADKAVWSDNGTSSDNASKTADELAEAAMAETLNTAAESISGACRWAQGTPGPVFDFSTITEEGEEGRDVNAIATDPYPADGDLHADCDGGGVRLAWNCPADGKTASQTLYFGLSDDLDGSTLRTETLAANDSTFDIDELNAMTVYYWRIDRTDADGNVTAGDVWTFQPRHLAFPDAEGYGRFAHGGRGGKVVYVTNLNDSGEGSLRDAVENNSGPRTIVFNVSGVIKLASRITVPDNDVTIAGQTAPGNGICISSAPFGIANDNICRFMRVRIGSGETYDGMGMAYADHSIMDHCSISWSIDEGFSSRGCQNLTLQRTMIAEALGIAGHRNYGEGKNHGFAATIGGDIGSFHHNLLADCNGRNWSMGGGVDANANYAGRLDIFNNVVYNWGGRVTDGGAHEVNFVGNYYKEGPASTKHKVFILQLEGTANGTQSAYLNDNILDLYNGTILKDNPSTWEYTLTNGQVLTWEPFVDQPFFESYANIQPVEEAYKDVLSDVGANQPFFDAHDQRIIGEAVNRTYTYTGSKSGIKGQIDSETDCGGLEVYPEEQWPESYDSDLDGMPDWWENLNGTDKNTADNNGDPDGDGFTNLEDYLNWLAAPHIIMMPKASEKISVQSLFAGYTSSPYYTYQISGEGIEATLDGDSLTISSISDANSLASVSVTVTDGEGSTKTRVIGVAVSDESQADAIKEIQSSAMNDIRQYEVFTIDGKKIASVSEPAGITASQLNIPVSAEGVYVVKTTDSKGQTHSFKVIKH